MIGKPFKEKGHEIMDPKDPSRGYRLTRDVYVGEITSADQFEPIGDVPKPMTNMEMPEFLGRALKVIL